MKLRGNDLIVFFYDGEKYVTLAYATSCELDISVELVEVGHVESGQWKRYKKRRKGWRVSSAHIVSDNHEAVDAMGLLESPKEVLVTIGSVEPHRDKLLPSEYVQDGRFMFTGNALVSRITVTGQVGNMATMSMEAQGSGKPEWKEYDSVIMTGDEQLFEREEKEYDVRYNREDQANG